MKDKGASGFVESRAGYWRRVLRPLLWWLLLILVLYGIRTHQRLMEQTRLNFTVTLAGQIPYPEAITTFDGKPIFSGQNISLGNHIFAVTHPKGDSYAAKFFVWYGPHNLGTIDLKRTMSVLSVTADPPAPVLSIHGPEWNVEMTNSPGMTSSVPTDQYVVMSRYAHWSRSEDVSVSAGIPTTWRIAPRLGAAHITCNEADAIGQFIQVNGPVIESVTFPYMISELPEGTYRITARHHNDVLSRVVNIVAGTTNNLTLEFLYGSAVLQTEPPGAVVQSKDGNTLGVTPLNVTELQPGLWTFFLRSDGYEPIMASLTITANESTTYQTNLLSVNYTGGMKTARQNFDAGNYDDALKTVGDVLLAKPGDAEALALQRNASGFRSLQRAKQLGSQGDFMEGGRELATTLTIFPDSAEAKALVVEYKRREPEQIEEQRVARLNRPRKVFEAVCAKYTDSTLFDAHELKTDKPFAEVEPAITAAMRDVQPGFVIMSDVINDGSLHPEIFALEGRQTVSGGLLSSGGSRLCLIVGGQTRDNETLILYKVLEYTTKHNVTMPGLLAFRDDQQELPLHPSRIPDMNDKLKAQLEEGITNVTARLQAAVGQTPVVQPSVSPSAPQ